MMDILADLAVQFDRPCDQVNFCCTTNRFGKIAPGSDPHTATLFCANCGARRGHLSQGAVTQITDIVRTFGAPDAPIILRAEGKPAPAPRRS